jgi:hypothetical protein
MTHLMIMHHTSKDHYFPYKSDNEEVIVGDQYMYSRLLNHFGVVLHKLYGKYGVDLILKNICYTHKGQERYLDLIFLNLYQCAWD